MVGKQCVLVWKEKKIKTQLAIKINFESQILALFETSFDYSWFLAKNLILYPSLENSTTGIAIMYCESGDLKTFAQSICTHYASLSGRPDTFLGSGTLNKRVTKQPMFLNQEYVVGEDWLGVCPKQCHVPLPFWLLGKGSGSCSGLAYQKSTVAALCQFTSQEFFRFLPYIQLIVFLDHVLIPAELAQKFKFLQNSCMGNWLLWNETTGALTLTFL